MGNGQWAIGNGQWAIGRRREAIGGEEKGLGFGRTTQGPGGQGERTLLDQPVKRLVELIRDVPDFPKPGVVFKDFMPLLADAGALALAVELMANPYRGRGVDVVVGAESRGFIFGTAVASALSAGFVPVRKPGKLPGRVVGVDYALEYGRDRLEMSAGAVRPGMKVLLVDDLLATGGTLKACAELVTGAGAELAGITVLIELLALGGRGQIVGHPEVHAVIRM
jgi:adenine phosphoribosyltransferase